MSVRVVESPLPAISVDEAKAHLREESTDNDALIATYIAAAQGSIDGPGRWLGRSIGKQLLELVLPLRDGFHRPEAMFRPDCSHELGIKLPYGPVLDVVSVQYGAALTLDPDAYDLVPDEATPDGVLWPKAGVWPWSALSDSCVTIRYHAGYEAMLAPIKAALFFMTADLYQTRDLKISAALVENPTVARLLAPFHVWRL